MRSRWLRAGRHYEAEHGQFAGLDLGHGAHAVQAPHEVLLGRALGVDDQLARRDGGVERGVTHEQVHGAPLAVGSMTLPHASVNVYSPRCSAM